MQRSQHAVYATGSWRPFPGQDEQFVAAWREFAAWSAERDGAGEPLLARDLRADGRYVSFSGWRDAEAMRAWKGHPEFKERMSRVQQFVDEFAPTELDVVARVGQE